MKKSLRIFYAADSSPNAGALRNSQIWYYNLYLPLIDLGHDVVPFNYDLRPHFQYSDPNLPLHKKFIQANRPKLEEALLEQIRAAHHMKPVDLFFSYFHSTFVRPKIIGEIRSMGIITMNWYCNASYQFNLVEEIAPAYDYCLVPEKFRLEDYHRIGANPIYCQEAANPNIYKPYPLPQEYDVTFVGQKYGDRPAYILYLLDNGINVRVWGPGWQTTMPVLSKMLAAQFAKLKTQYGWKGALLQARHNWRQAAHLLASQLDVRLSKDEEMPVQLPQEICGETLSDEELIKMYSRSKISLGFSSCGETQRCANRVLQVRLRDFEAPMSGTFYMTEYMSELEEFFDIGKEIVCYHDKTDLADKIRYYLAHDNERERIRHAGHQRAVSDHSWHKRFETIFHEIGLDS